jgi:hypothetical protein
MSPIDVVEIDLPSARLVDATARHDDAHESKRDRRAERSRVITCLGF